MRVLIHGLLLLLTLGLVTDSMQGSDQVPGELPAGPVAITGATVHTVSSGVLEKATVVFQDGKIIAVGTDVEVPSAALRIEGAGKHVYPGLVACGTTLGLVEIGAVRATRDASESGSMNPNARAITAVNPDSELLPVTRSNGITHALTRPTGGLISGTSALIRLDGWTAEDMALESDLGVHVNWPRRSRNPDPGERKKAMERRAESIETIREAFEKARLSRDNPDALAPDLRASALIPCLEKRRPVIVHAQTEEQIRSALDFIEELDLKAVIFGGREAPLVTDRLKELDVPVIFGAVHALPRVRDADIHSIFEAPRRLYEAGVRFAIAGMETSNARNLPYQAASAAAHGLPAAEALRAVTLGAAEVLGVDDRIGSIEVGKHASLIITDGDPLEITTRTLHMWIQGRPVDLTNRQTMLRDKYRERLRRK